MNILFLDTGFLYHLFHYTDDNFFHILGGITLLFGFFLQAVDNFFFLIENCAENLCPADVKTDIIGFRHECYLQIDILSSAPELIFCEADV